jgi:hypothetical protein
LVEEIQRETELELLAVKGHIQVVSSELEVKIEESDTETQGIMGELTRQRERVHELEQPMNKQKLETVYQVKQLKAEIAALNNKSRSRLRLVALRLLRNRMALVAWSRLCLAALRLE